MISVRSFGKTPDGQDAQLFILENGGISVYITDFGANIVAVNVPDKNGILTDIALGFDDASYYDEKADYLGATVGRHANRIENGVCELNGISYKVAVNNGPNHLHGGKKGFNSRMFDAFVDEDTLTLSYISPDMEEGFPGELKFSVSFTVTQKGELEINYRAESNKDTVVNFTNHSYFNLNGAISEKSIYNHTLKVYGQAFCEADSNGLANGKIIPVKETVLDFTTPKNLGECLDTEDEILIGAGGGIDHNYVLSMQRGTFRKAAEVYCEETGIAVDCYTDQPGIQIYTGNFLDIKNGKFGANYSKHSGICLETQNFPNATTYSYFPSPVLAAGDVFTSKTVYVFYTK